MLPDSVNITSDALNCKEIMSKETYENQMNAADRLIYLINVLNDKIKYK